MKKLIIALALFSGLAAPALAVSQPNAIGNVSITKQVYAPTSQNNVSTHTPVNISATNMVITSTGGVVTFLQVGRAVVDGPAITTSTARSGQYLILSSTTTASTVVITTGTSTAVFSPSDATITISAIKPPMAFIFDATLSVWRAIGKQ